MGKGDRRNSNKMLRRHSRAKYKARQERGPGPARAPSVKKAAPEEPDAAPEDDEAEQSTEAEPAKAEPAKAEASAEGA